MERAPIDQRRLAEALAPRWSDVRVVAEARSTNADLLAGPDTRDRTVLVAEHQTAGRGRFDRAWTSPPGAGVLFSALFRPAVPLLRWGWLPLLAGLALAESVADETGVDTALKWPNDLLAGPNRRKAAGILVQSVADAVVIGIGLNVTTTADELPVPTATSLALEGGTVLDRTALLAAVLTRLDARVAQWADCGGDVEASGLAAAYRARCATLGAPVRVTAADGSVIEGLARDVDAAGRLLIGEHVLAAGDVEQLRPTG